MNGSVLSVTKLSERSDRGVCMNKSSMNSAYVGAPTSTKEVTSGYYRREKDRMYVQGRRICLLNRKVIPSSGSAKASYKGRKGELLDRTCDNNPPRANRIWDMKDSVHEHRRRKLPFIDILHLFYRMELPISNF